MEDLGSLIDLLFSVFVFSTWCALGRALHRVGFSGFVVVLPFAGSGVAIAALLLTYAGAIALTEARLILAAVAGVIFGLSLLLAFGRWRGR